ncbi:MAG: nuclear transport factor 2 family protein [Acidobacteria bacterium]|nr:nuclear transport factor 2 family protein [Acidobacteriota bacterium]
MTGHTEIIRGLYAAFAAGNVPAVLERLDPQVRWTEAEGFPYGGTYVGHEAVLGGVLAKLATEWDGFAVVPEEFIAERDIVVAVGRYSGVFKESGKAFTAPFAHVWRLRDGRVVEFRQHTDTLLVQRATR